MDDGRCYRCEMCGGWIYLEERYYKVRGSVYCFMCTEECIASEEDTEEYRRELELADRAHDKEEDGYDIVK